MNKKVDENATTQEEVTAAEGESSAQEETSFAFDAFEQLDELDSDAAEGGTSVGVEPATGEGTGEPSSPGAVSSPDALGAAATPPLVPAGQVPATAGQDPAQVAAAQAAAPPQGSQPPGAQTAAPPATAPQQPGAAEAASPGEPPAPSTLDALAQAVEANKAVFTDALATTVYKMSDEDMAGLDTDPANTIPKLLARCHVHIVQHTLGTIAAHLPQMVHGVQEAQRQHDAAEEEFFNAWPALKADKAKYRGQVIEVARHFRSQNPKTPKADMIKFVGAQVMVMNGLVGQPQPVAQAPAPQAATTAAAGFVPAGGGLPLTAPTKQVVDVWADAYAQLGDENDVEDVDD